MAEFDTVIRNAVVVTAADVFPSDIGIAGGVVTTLAGALLPAWRAMRSTPASLLGSEGD